MRRAVVTYLQSSLKPNLLGAITFSVLLFFTFFFSIQQYRIAIEQETFVAYTKVNDVKNRMQEAFANSISATHLLSFFVTEYDGVQNFDSIARKIFKHQKYIDAVELVPNGVICCVYPLEGNENVVGYNIMEDVNRNLEAIEAINRRQLYFAGPFELRQGGMGVVGRLPIFIDDKFWGFSAVVIKLSTLLRAAGIDSNQNEGYQFQLSKINPNTGKEEFFLNGNLDSKKMVSAEVIVPSGEWKLSAAQIEGQAALFQTLPIFIFGLLLSFTGAAFMRVLSEAPLSLGKRLDESNKKYKNIFNNTSEGIFRSTVEGELILVNPSFAKIFGYNSVKEVLNAVNNIGQSMYYNKGDREKLLGELLVKGNLNKMETRGKKKSGEMIWISVNAHLVYEEDEAIKYIEGTITDITERKNDRDKLNEQFSVLMKYAHINSHEVRAHVATLLGLANLIKGGYLTHTEREKAIDLMNQETLELDEVIRGLSNLINEVEEY